MSCCVFSAGCRGGSSNSLRVGSDSRPQRSRRPCCSPRCESSTMCCPRSLREREQHGSSTVCRPRSLRDGASVSPRPWRRIRATTSVPGAPRRGSTPASIRRRRGCRYTDPGSSHDGSSLGPLLGCQYATRSALGCRYTDPRSSCVPACRLAPCGSCWKLSRPAPRCRSSAPACRRAPCGRRRSR